MDIKNKDSMILDALKFYNESIINQMNLQKELTESNQESIKAQLSSFIEAFNLTLGARIDSLVTKIKDLEEDFDKVDGKIDIFDKDLIKMEHELRTLKNEVEVLKVDFAVYKTKTDSLHTTIDVANRVGVLGLFSRVFSWFKG
jgi:chromosome segregation ATPase